MQTVHVRAHAVDADGNIYLVGLSNQPLGSGTVQPMFAGGGFDAFVAKWSPDGTRLIYATNVGGTSTDAATAISIDAAGNAYIAGYTYSVDFPVTAGAFQTRNANPQPPPGGKSCFTDECPGGNAFVAKVSPDGRSLLYSTFLGGSGNDSASAITVDSQGKVVVTGTSYSPDFPISQSAHLNLKPYSGTFVASLNSDGSALVYSTYFEAPIKALALDNTGNVYVTGGIFNPDLPVTPQAAQTRFGGNFDAFVASLNSSGSTVRYATYLGGANYDIGLQIQVTTAGEAWVTGQTWSSDLAVVNAAQPHIAGRSCPGAPLAGPFDAGPCGDWFVAKISPVGDRFLFLTYLGGSGSDSPTDLLLEPAGTALVLGASSASFPVTAGAWLKVACWRQSFARIGPTGDLLAASFVADPTFLTPAGSVMSWSRSSLVDVARSVPQGLACMLNAAALVPYVGSQLALSLDQPTLAQYGGIVAPGEIVTLAGWGLGPQSAVQAQTDASGFFPKQLAGVQVLFDGTPAPLLYVQAGQINAVVPYSVAGATSITLTVAYGGTATPAVKFLVDTASPAIFSQDGSGIGPSAVLNEDGTLNSPANPAPRGSIIQIFATGGGQTVPAAQDGRVNTLGSLNLPVKLRTAPIDAEILYAGPAPGLISGAIQINARVSLETRVGTGISISLTIGTSVSSLTDLSVK